MPVLNNETGKQILEEFCDSMGPEWILCTLERFTDEWSEDKPMMRLHFVRGIKKMAKKFEGVN